MSKQELVEKVLASLGSDFAHYDEDDITLILDVFLEKVRTTLAENKEQYPVNPGLFVKV